MAWLCSFVWAHLLLGLLVELVVNFLRDVAAIGLVGAHVSATDIALRVGAGRGCVLDCHDGQPLKVESA